MKYRELGRTGIMAGQIGMGCEGFIDKDPAVVKEYIDAMEQLGMNTIDMYNPDPVYLQALGEALKGRREKFVLQLHIGSIWDGSQYERSRDVARVRENFPKKLRQLQTDYADIGMIHYCDALDDWNELMACGIMDYAKELKAAGTIRAIGVSTHNPEVGLAAVRDGVEVIMFSVNPCYDLLPATEDVEQLWNPKNYENSPVNMDPQRQAFYETCQREGVGITVMKAFGGGDLLNAEDSPAGLALTANQCMHYALTRPGVGCVIAGCRNLEQIYEAAAYENATDEERDYAPAFAKMKKVSWQGHCMYCGHCAPCPKGIDVATVTKFLNLAKVQGSVPETVREHYAVLDHKAGECVSCGACEKRCPFGVSIRENMRKAKEIFGS